jgi:4-hydroxy-2-oxoheptanedioate aldolase
MPRAVTSETLWVVLLMRLIEKIRSGGEVLGTWNLLGDPQVIEIMGSAGFDFAIIDMEHGAHGYSTAVNLAIAARASGLGSIIRPSGVDESAILRSLDVGVDGILVPNISSVQQVDRLIDYAFYPPRGARGHSPFTRAGGYTHSGATATMQRINSDLLLGILIEGGEGILALPEILRRHSDILSVVYVGMYDLAKSLGFPGDIHCEAVLAGAESIANLVKKNGVAAGVLVTKTEDFEAYRQLGFSFFCFQNDTGILKEKVETVSREFQMTRVGC